MEKNIKGAKIRVFFKEEGELKIGFLGFKPYLPLLRRV